MAKTPKEKEKKEPPKPREIECSGHVLDSLWTFLDIYGPDGKPESMIQVHRHLQLMDALEECMVGSRTNGAPVTPHGFRLDEDTMLRYPQKCHETLRDILGSLGGRLTGNGRRTWRKIIRHFDFEDDIFIKDE